MDFLMVSARTVKKGLVEIYPKFIIKKSNDLMIRGGDFYAIWDDSKNMWSTDEDTALYLIDKELDAYYDKHKDNFRDDNVKILHMWDADSGSIDRWHKYCQKQMRDQFHVLDEQLIFSNYETTKKDYASKSLPYALADGSCPSWDELIDVLYSPEERHKIEWAIGSIVSGESRNLQKFMVMYGSAGTGKSTVLNIIQMLFDGYYSVFDAKALGSASNVFALEAFKTNPLVAIQHDGDLSHIEDNTRLNSVVSHELMTVNEKFKSTYASRFNCFLFMGTNKPVKITDAKSGILRRLIDVSPTGKKVSASRYKELNDKIKFELGAIAYKCKELYLEDRNYYDAYVPLNMMESSNTFYNFVLDSYDIFAKEDGTSLKSAWELYKQYCEDAKISYPLPKMIFKDELKNYFKNFDIRSRDENRSHNWYSGFLKEKFEASLLAKPIDISIKKSFDLLCNESLLDKMLWDCPAQLANEDETPLSKWEKVTTLLKDIDTSKVHYVRVPENHIVIDFDLKDSSGQKSRELNLEAASKWPETYAEFSKGGNGVHLHYIYDGDVSRLSRVYSEGIEVKVFTGKSALRRRLTQCNDIPVATISSGLPLKGEQKVLNFSSFKNEKGLRTTIERNLRKEIHPGTKPSVDFIFKILDDAYSSGMKYDVTDMRPAIMSFALKSTHQSEYCLKLVDKMKFKSDDISNGDEYNNDMLVFYDVEVFPNLFVVVYKMAGDHRPVKLINPKPVDIEKLLKYKLIGFNCRDYDNHIMYARLLGYDNQSLYKLSKRIIEGSPNSKFGEAYNISYTDIYDFSSEKKSLKKFEIELGIHHQELGLPWDQPVDEKLWDKVADYCVNDVVATEAVWNARQGDFIAREILADIAGGTVNDTTNTLTTKLIFGSNKKPQSQFCYRDLSQPVEELDDDVLDFLEEKFPEMMNEPFEIDGVKSLLPFFPGYKYDKFKRLSTYKDVEEVGEGGRVWADPGMYPRVKVFDVGSMHPHSVTSECLFGPEYTRIFSELMEARMYIKHKDFESAGKLFGGKLAKYLDDPAKAKALAAALKIAINSVYGLTAARFEHAFKDPRNVDNIVAKRGALFMIDLMEQVTARGGKVIHIKTDSIKVVDPTPEIEEFILSFGKRYGYDFEVEHIFEKICLVNDAVYIAKCAEDDPETPGQWTATGTQFAVPYVFKTLFSHEPITFSDLCETKSVKTALYLDLNENLDDVSMYEKEMKDREKKNVEYVNPTLISVTDPELKQLVDGGHNYHFVGKVGQFCPMNPGSGGGNLLREKDGTYSSATGAKGYRWMESEVVKQLGKEDQIDISYYNALVDDAVAKINEFGNLEWFAA